MKLVTKISVTASILFVVLSQIFSGYLIYQNYTEKLKLVTEKELELVENATHRMIKEASMKQYDNSVEDQVKENLLITSFRSNMLRDSAIYQGDGVICNTTGFLFENMLLKDNEQQKMDTNLGKNGIVDEENLYKFKVQPVTMENEHYLLFWECEEVWGNYYVVYHMLNITELYSSSRSLVVREVMVSLVLAAGMTVLLYILIQRITQPLRNTNELQQQFIGGMAHELRTPLTAMKGYSQTLLEVKLTEEQEEKALHYINSECDRLSHLSEKMAELTRLYQTDDMADFRQISAENLFERVRQTEQGILESRELILEYEGTWNQWKRRGDEELLIALLINLVNNAVIASKPGDRIWLGADEKRIWVRDEGCGIPQTELSNVKKAFYRVDKSRSRKSGNMGLGLSICERIAAIHRGRLQIESRLGVGTKISLEF